MSLKIVPANNNHNQNWSVSQHEKHESTGNIAQKYTRYEQIYCLSVEVLGTKLIKPYMSLQP